VREKERKNVCVCFKAYVNIVKSGGGEVGIHEFEGKRQKKRYKDR